jgi:tripartite-type tricarboxylate transporter receptor subunit TctC
MNRTLFGTLAAWLAIAACLFPAWAAAQPFPSRPIRLIVPYPPGGNTDIVARLYGQKLAERIGQPVIFDNRGGAAGTLGLGAAAKSPNDGYTLSIGDLGSMVIAKFANPNVTYDPQKDFAPVGLVSAVSIVVTANPKSPANNIGEFIALARAQPGKLTYGSSGVGAPGHLAFELLRSMTKIDIVHVPFKGGAQAVTALIGEHVDVLADGAAFAQVKAGRLKALAVTGPRLPALPDVPGIGESVPGFSFTNWWGILAPAGTPPEAVGRLSEELRQIAALPEIGERLNSLGLAPQSSTPQQFADHIRTETEKVGRIVREAGIKFE